MAAQHDGSYPRPQLVRDEWRSLDGPWAFTYDDERLGEPQRWYDVDEVDRFPLTIQVPFPPESPASGVHDTGFHPVVWYRRTITSTDLGVAESSTDRTLLHFGAVDHSARVWFDGVLVAEHTGGQTPFQADITDLLGARDEHVLVVRAEDDPVDISQPRGKQDWELVPHVVWYHRTTGIWQSVWTETVPTLRVAGLAWTPHVSQSSLECEVTLSARPTTPVVCEISLSLDGDHLASQAIRLDGPRAVATIAIPALANGQDRGRFLWSPEHPVLIDARLELRPVADARVLDVVDSYVGLRSVGVGKRHFRLNGQPYYLRAVLNQGYREQTHLANAGSESLRAEVELIKQLGFNAVRLHQKAEDPRFLYWADRLGLLVWAETANAYEFTTLAVELLTREWLELVRRDRSHPSIVTWVPINESWGVQDIAVNATQQAYTGALASLTRALDPSRPVMSNEGWEHVDSDILGLHDYSSSVEALMSRYGDAAAIEAMLDSPGPAGKAAMLSSAQRARYDAGDAPLMITEFGGISHASADETWGYSTVQSDDEYAQLLSNVFEALRDCPAVVGFCYTQLVDTAQEANGLLTVDYTPKLPLDRIRQIVTGQPRLPATSMVGWDVPVHDGDSMPSTATVAHPEAPEASADGASTVQDPQHAG